MTRTPSWGPRWTEPRARTPGTTDDRQVLEELYRAAVLACAPEPVTVRALEGLTPPPDARIWIIALGKASLAMTKGALAFLRERGTRPAGGVVVAAEDVPSPDPFVSVLPGDHPDPGERSLAAARRIGEIASEVADRDEVWVLLSGGATSLTAAPVDGIDPADLVETNRLLLRSGLDIGAMNLIRKRLTRWGGGRLAAALAPARVRCFAISDVIGDDPATIGSGPCVADDSAAAEVRDVMIRAGLWREVPARVRALLDAAASDPARETPKSGSAAFANVEMRIIATNRLALDGAASRAASLGIVCESASSPISGESAEAGGRLARELLDDAGEPGDRGRCLLWGGETTVTLRGAGVALGGRCQELALAAARTLANGTGPTRATLLAAGTDGRDGPTDAAGAIVDGETWERIRLAGHDPACALAEHNAYPALDAAHALMRTGLTGTNVMDVMIGMRQGAGSRE